MIFREAAVSDFDGILALEKQIFEMHHAARPDMINPEKMPFSPEYFEKCLEDRNFRIFVAEENKAVAGFCIVRKNDTSGHPMFNEMTIAEIEDLCVDENHRNRGAGKKLFEKAMQFARENGIKKIALSVWEFNRNAKEFYERLGMKTRIRKMEMDL